MTNKNFFYLAFFQKLIKELKKRLKKFLLSFQKTTKKHRRTFEQFQLTLIYFCALVVLTYTIKNSLGYFPEMLFKLFPFLVPIFDIQALKILAAPEKTFVVYMLILELFINRSHFNFSLIVKFNVLLIFILEMLQNLIISYWDILFNRELDVFNGGIVIARNATMLFSCFLFLFFFALYLYSYIVSFLGFFPVFPGILKIITDSVAFWLQIKPYKEQKEQKKNKET